jgi:hypothetical protein
MTAHAEDMVLVPPAELDALRAENRRLRREAGDREALERIWSDSGEGRTFTREELRRRGELVSDRALRFPDRTWDELEGLPQPLRNAAHRAIFHLLEEPVPALADPFPEVDPLPGAYPSPSTVGRPDHLVHGHGESRRAGRRRCAIRQSRHMNMARGGLPSRDRLARQDS